MLSLQSLLSLLLFPCVWIRRELNCGQIKNQCQVRKPAREITYYLPSAGRHACLVIHDSFLSRCHRWGEGEPSSVDKERRKEDCVAIHADPDWGKWSDERCIMETPFVCKTRGKGFDLTPFQMKRIELYFLPCGPVYCAARCTKLLQVLSLWIKFFCDNLNKPSWAGHSCSKSG